ncbi:MAG: hypothetical protein ACI9OJ_004501, partial [Myxococcota bacterium]
ACTIALARNDADRKITPRRGAGGWRWRSAMSIAQFALRTTTPLTLATALLVPIIGSAQVGGKCGIELNKPADDVHHYSSFMSAAKALNPPTEAAPTDEVAARKSLCSGTSKAWEATDTRDGVDIHVLIADDKGGVWVIYRAG